MKQSSNRCSRRRCLQTGFAALAATSMAPPVFGWAKSGLTKQDAKHKLRVLTESPLNAEASLEELVKHYHTPLEHFYIRTNGNIPTAHVDDHEIAFEGLVERPQSISLKLMQRLFGHEEQAAVLMCAGNRRTEMGQVKKVSGTPWTTGAIGNASWRGFNLAKVLRYVGVQRAAKHVWFESIDRCKMKSGGETSFGGSIPIEKAMEGTCLLARLMNDKPLTSDHGAPVRAIVPGYIGARSVKWLGKIVLSDKPSPNHYVAENYKIVADTKPETLAAAEPIYEYSINSLICDPAEGAKLKAGEVTLRGIALPRGGRNDRVKKVEILDAASKVLCEATLMGPGEAFCWEPWEATLELARGTHSLGVRATGNRGDVQPLEPNWNALGYLFNAPHRVTVSVS
jgi:sulfite oxidase